MIIPTYWSTPDISSWKVFDHPVPISEEGTLQRTLDNLENIGYPDAVILFPAPADTAIEARVKGLAAGRSLDIRVFSETDIAAIRVILGRRGFPAELLRAVDLNSYGGVRNMGLLYAALHGFENIVMIDDDECVDEGYRSAALRYMGERVEGREVLGKTGCVLDEEGRKLYDGQASFVLENWPKDELFNALVRESLEADKRLSDCAMAFGGNMVLNREMYTQVPFDPYGTRGEDDDYVLNARYCGFSFFFDQDLLLLHLPPKRKGEYWARHRQDIFRFKYIREKARLFGLDPKSLGIFLEYFTQDDLEYKAVSSSIFGALQFVDSDRNEFREFLNNAVLAETLPPWQLRARAETFLRFVDAWQKIVPEIVNQAY
jgi:GT2 family glycosyltransferase